MKTELVLLLILDVFNSAESEFRHHQQDRYARDNSTAHPWSSTTQFRINEEKRVTEINNPKQGWAATSPEETRGVEGVSAPQSKPLEPFYDARKFFDENRPPNPTRPIFGVGDEEKGEKRTGGISSSGKMEKVRKLAEAESSTKSFAFESSEFLFLRPSSSKRKTKEQLIPVGFSGGTYSRNYSTDEEHPTADGKKVFLKKSPREDADGEERKNLNSFRKMSNFARAEPLVALTDSVESDACVENFVEDFSVSDDLVSATVLTDRDEAEKLARTLANNGGDLDGVTDLMESILERHPRISSVSVTAAKRAEKSKLSQTVYRKGNDLLVDRQSHGYPEFSSDRNRLWTPLFRNCLTKTWIFGYSFAVENVNARIDATVYFDADQINGTVDQCKPSFRQVLDGGPKCDSTTTQCVAISHSGFSLGGYKCVCLEGFYFPDHVQAGEHHFKGVDLERNSENRNSSLFRCLPCPDSCSGSCSISGFCIFRRNNFLSNSVLFVQVFCVLTTTALTVLIFKHRKCKTIATGMWTIMEMILLGSVILYGTIIIRVFDSSTVLCLIEPWCREMGFVLCYGAIILKLYRILIEFRTRKAHRWVIRDKDLLKYLLGMVIVVFGYMSAWTATNLYLIRRESYSMLTTGVTLDGVHYNACKPVWWDYVTEISEILILIFGIHLSYASRNATTQFRERCFLCISISVEALVSGTFYILRYFYWETTVHPDFNLLAHFTRCQLTTTIVLLLLFTPKWWYQKVQINKGRVSRNYLMQESGRGPLEAFKPQDGVTATNSDVEGEISLADMNPEDIRAELKRLYTQLEVLKNKTIRFDNPHISKRRGGRKIAHRRFSLQKKGSREKALRQQTQRLSSKLTDVEVTEAEASRTPEDSVCSNEGPSVILYDGPSDIVHMTPKKSQK